MILCIVVFGCSDCAGPIVHLRGEALGSVQARHALS